MTFEAGVYFWIVAALLASSALTIGYVLGLRRFTARARAEGEVTAGKLAVTQRLLDAAREAAERATSDAEQRVAAARSEPIPTVTHQVLLDGPSGSGKSTLVHRLAFPCTDAESLARITATQTAYRTRVLPICFVPLTADDPSRTQVLHTQVFRDIAGENPGGIVDIINELAARGDVTELTCVLVWDMADSIGSRQRMPKDRLKAAYQHTNGRRLIKTFIVFFNKIDLLELPAEHIERLIADERAYVRSLLDFLDADVSPVFVAGSARRGDGITDVQGAIYTALGLGAHFLVDDKASRAS